MSQLKIKPQDLEKSKPAMNGNIWESNTQEYLNYGQDQDRFWFQSYEEEELNYKEDPVISETSYSSIQFDSLKQIVQSLILNTAYANNITSGRALQLLYMSDYNPNSIGNLSPKASFNQLPSSDSKMSTCSSRQQKRKLAKLLKPCLRCLNKKDLKCLECKHLICKSCWRSDLTEAITCSSKKDNLIGKTCLIEGCNELISLEFIEEIVDRNTYQRYLSIFADDYAEKMKLIKCRNLECHCFFQSNASSQSSSPISMFCRCDTSCCSSCLQEAHSPMSCQLFLDLLENKKRLRILLDNPPDTQQCPSCGILIEIDVQTSEFTCICENEINFEDRSETRNLAAEKELEVRLYEEQKRAIEDIKEQKCSYERQEENEFNINPYEISVGFIQNAYQQLIETTSFSTFTRLVLLNIPIATKKSQKVALVSLEMALQALSDKIEEYRKIIQFYLNKMKKDYDCGKLVGLEKEIMQSISKVGDLKRNLSQELKKLKGYQRQMRSQLLAEVNANREKSYKKIEDIEEMSHGGNEIIGRQMSNGVQKGKKIDQKMGQKTDKPQDQTKKQLNKQAQVEDIMSFSYIIKKRKGGKNQSCRSQELSNNSRLDRQGNRQQASSRVSEINGQRTQKWSIDNEKETSTIKYCNNCLNETTLFYLCERCRELILKK